MSAVTERTYNGHRLFLPCPSCRQGATGTWHCPSFPKPITEILLGLVIFGTIPECPDCVAFVTTCDLCWHINYEVGLAILHDADQEMEERRLRVAMERMQVNGSNEEQVNGSNGEQQHTPDELLAFRAPLPLDPTMSPGQISQEWIDSLNEGSEDLSTFLSSTAETPGSEDRQDVPQAAPAPAEAPVPSSSRWGLRGRAEICVPVWGGQGASNGQGGFGAQTNQVDPGQQAQGGGMGQGEQGAEKMEIE